jgi:hypothetical protein
VLAAGPIEVRQRPSAVVPPSAEARVHGHHGCREGGRGGALRLTRGTVCGQRGRTARHPPPCPGRFGLAWRSCPTCVLQGKALVVAGGDRGDPVQPGRRRRLGRITSARHRSARLRSARLRSAGTTGPVAGARFQPKPSWSSLPQRCSEHWRPRPIGHHLGGGVERHELVRRSAHADLDRLGHRAERYGFPSGHSLGTMTVFVTLPC